MAYEANFRPAAGAARSGAGASARRAPQHVLVALRHSESLRAAWRVFWPIRLAVVLVAIFAALSLGPPGQGGLGEENAAKFDQPALTAPIGGFGKIALAPLARWDAIWYLRVADQGYPDGGAEAAFFPAYPLLTRGLAAIGGGSRGAVLVAAYVVSLAAFLAALALFHRLVSLELGRRLAGPALLLLALFPGALYFGAPYSESLFLLASVGAFYAARTRRWPWAGACLAGAAATRSAGVLLVVPIALVYLEQVRAGGRRSDGLWLLLGPAGIGAFALYLGLSQGDAFAFSSVQDFWYRDFAGPLVGAWDGLVAAVDGARQLLSGSREPVYFTQAGGDPFRVAEMNLMLFGFLVFALVACWGALRRLPTAYGVWVAVALLLPLTFPVGPQPLMSLPRFLAVLFPIFMWLAVVCDERGWTDRVAGLFGVGLGLFTVEFATWHWIA
jgi:mannosyltransferase PIG-V